MFDVLISNALIVDGTGSAGRVGSVAIHQGRIAAVGDIDGEAAETIDGTGLVLCPGFVDPHTHYDAQLFWDPFASPSNRHGVTSIIAGNCGFTLAPAEPGDAEYLTRMMAKVEGMPLAAIENGVPWNWRTFEDYLGRLDGNIGVNAAFLVGHCALRRWVMGADSIGNEATQEQIDQMKVLLRQAIEAGGMGFSTSLAFTHSDGDGEPVPSRWATPDEVVQLSEVVKDYEGTTLEFIIDGCLNGFQDDEIELMINMSLAARRPLNWNVLTVDSREPERYRRQLEAGTKAYEAGARIVALTMPTLVGMTMSFGSFCGLWLLPGWKEVLDCPVEERIERLSDPAVRDDLNKLAQSDEAGVLKRLTSWERYEIGDTYSEANEGLKGRVVGDIAAERGQDPFDTLLDIVINDDCQTILWPLPSDDDEESWKMRAQIWDDPRCMIGGSDAGAHLDRMCGSNYPTVFLGDCIRGRKLATMEQAIHYMTDVPARFFGLKDRGRIEEGWHADLVLFDPETIDAGPITMVSDLPGNTDRLYSESIGVKRVWVNGQTIVDGADTTGALPGKILRSGVDTETVPIPADL